MIIAELLGEAGSDEARLPMLEQLCSEDEESARVRQALLMAIYQRGFKVVDRKEDLADHLGGSWRVGPKGTLIVAD